jgi:hypothetical protein
VNKHPIANRPNVVKIGFRINFKNKQKNEHIYRLVGIISVLKVNPLQIISLENPESADELLKLIAWILLGSKCLIEVFGSKCLTEVLDRSAGIEVPDRSAGIEVLDRSTGSKCFGRTAWIEVPDRSAWIEQITFLIPQLICSLREHLISISRTNNFFT